MSSMGTAVTLWLKAISCRHPTNSGPLRAPLTGIFEAGLRSREDEIKLREQSTVRICTHLL